MLKVLCKKRKSIYYHPLIYTSKTVNGWIIKFDGILADALELGAFWENRIEIPDSILNKLRDRIPGNGIPGVKTLIKYYIANRQSDTDWFVISHINLDAYLASNTFTKKLISKVPDDILIRSSSNHGVNRYKISPEFLP